MNTRHDEIIEPAAWGFEENVDRSGLVSAHAPSSVEAQAQRIVACQAEWEDGYLKANDWPARCEIALPDSGRSEFMHSLNSDSLILTSENPDICLRFKPFNTEADRFELKVHLTSRPRLRSTSSYRPCSIPREPWRESRVVLYWEHPLLSSGAGCDRLPI